MTRTRHQQRHRDIRRVHVNLRPHQIALPSVRHGVSLYLHRVGVKQFLCDVFNGDLQLPAPYGVVSRRVVLNMIDQNVGLRGDISRRWRQEPAHHHEWIPCTYLCNIISRALRANDDFRYIRLAHAMRTPTESLIFSPAVAGPRMIVRRRNYGPGPRHGLRVLAVLQCHPGGLQQRTAPLGQYVTQMPAAVNGRWLVGGSRQFHNAILHELGLPGTPQQLVARLRAIFVQYCWNGVLPVNGYDADHIWNHYQRGGGRLVGAASFQAFARAVRGEYRRTLREFDHTWRNIARAAATNAPLHWV